MEALKNTTDELFPSIIKVSCLWICAVVLLVEGNDLAGGSRCVLRMRISLSEMHMQANRRWSVCLRRNMAGSCARRIIMTGTFPILTVMLFPAFYTRKLRDRHDFIRRSPEEYEAWMDGVSGECEVLELRILQEPAKEEKLIFVDTNINIETLKNIADHDHVLVMLADPEISVRRFFERSDREKQFQYQLIMEEADPEKAMENYGQGLMRIDSQEKYDRFLHSGFNVLVRDENRSIEETLAMVERLLGLKKEAILD